MERGGASAEGYLSVDGNGLGWAVSSTGGGVGGLPKGEMKWGILR